MEETAAALNVDYDLATKVREACGIRPETCYQCRKCSSGCPLTFAMDYLPDQIVRFLSLGLEERVLSSRTIWICSSCETCTTRCPNDIDIAGLMDYLKQEAHARGIVPEECRFTRAFHQAFLDDVARRGRVYEIGLLNRFFLSSGAWKARLAQGTLWDEARMGFRLWKKGRLPLFPHKVQSKEEIRRIFQGALSPRTATDTDEQDS